MKKPAMKTQAMKKPVVWKLLSEGDRWKTSILLYLEIIIHSTPYMNGRATMLGVFKAHAFFSVIVPVHWLTCSKGVH